MTILEHDNRQKLSQKLFNSLTLDGQDGKRHKLEKVGQLLIPCIMYKIG